MTLDCTVLESLSKYRASHDDETNKDFVYNSFCCCFRWRGCLLEVWDHGLCFGLKRMNDDEDDDDDDQG